MYIEPYIVRLLCQCSYGDSHENGCSHKLQSNVNPWSVKKKVWFTQAYNAKYIINHFCKSFMLFSVYISEILQI